MDGALIYAKTPKGVEEVATRSDQLSMVARRVLIMMDGKRTVDDLSVYVRPGEIDSIITQLESAGLAEKAGTHPPSAAPRTVVRSTIQPVTQTAHPTVQRTVQPTLQPTVQPTIQPARAPATDDREVTTITLEEAKRRAVRELNDRLGPTAEVMAMRIEACRTIDQFRERVREAERFVTTALGPAAAQEYLRALRRRS